MIVRPRAPPPPSPSRVQAVVDLSLTAEAGDLAVTRRLAGALKGAAGPPLPESFRSAVRDGTGLVLGVELARQLRVGGRAGDAAGLERALAAGLHDLHADVIRARDPLAADRLARTLAPLIPGAIAASDLPGTLGRPLIEAAHQLLADVALLRTRRDHFG